MFNWIIAWIRSKIGHWLLEYEEAENKARDEERYRKMQEIVDAHYETTDTADDFDRGEF